MRQEDAHRTLTPGEPKAKARAGAVLIALAALLAGQAHAQVADVALRVSVVPAGNGRVAAEARYFVARGAALGVEAADVAWTLERCDEDGCRPRRLRVSMDRPWRVRFRPDRRGLYVLRAHGALGLVAEASWRRGAF